MRESRSVTARLLRIAGAAHTAARPLAIIRRMRNNVCIMRRSRTLDALFPKTRQRLLATTMLAPKGWLYMSQLAEHVGTSPSSLQRELQRFTEAGILERRQDGRRIYYRARPDSPVFRELRGLMTKTVGIIPTLRAEMENLGKGLKWAAVYGSIAREEEGATSDIDVLVVGDLRSAELIELTRRVGTQFGREVNIRHYSEREFSNKIKGGDHFLASILKSRMIGLAGSRDELEEAAR